MWHEDRGSRDESKRRKPRLCAWAVLAALTAVPQQAHAHAQLLRSNPADGASLAKSPKQIDVWFNELLEDGFNVLQVFPSNQLLAEQRTNLAEGKVKVDPKDQTHLEVEVRPLVPGEYVAEWRVLSRDGHSAPGRIRFRVLAPQ